MSLKAKIEAVIYASEEPVTLAQLTGVLGQEAQSELDRIAVRQHRDDDIRSGRRFRAAVEHCDTIADRGFGGRGHRVKAPHGVTGGDQIRRHGTPHVAEAQKRDLERTCHDFWPSYALARTRAASARPMTTRMISLVPSRMRCTRRSRTIFSRPYSRR